MREVRDHRIVEGASLVDADRVLDDFHFLRHLVVAAVLYHLRFVAAVAVTAADSDARLNQAIPLIAQATGAK